MKKLRSQIVIIILAALVTSCNSDDDGLFNLEEIIVEDFSITIDEDPDKEQVLGSIKASATTGEITFSLISQTPEGAFTIDEVTGELAVANKDLFDFDINPTLTAVVSVTNGNMVKKARITVNLNELGNITAEDLSVTIEENPDKGQILGSIETSATDEEITFSLISQIPEGAFTIDTTTGEISVNDEVLFNYERNETMSTVVEISGNTIKTTTASVTVTLNDLEGIAELKGENGFVFEGNAYKTPQTNIGNYCNDPAIALEFASENVENIGSPASISGQGDYFLFRIRELGPVEFNGIANGRYEINNSNGKDLVSTEYRFHLDTTFPNSESLGGGEITEGYIDFDVQRNNDAPTTTPPFDLVSVTINVTFKDGKKLIGKTNVGVASCDL